MLSATLWRDRLLFWLGLTKGNKSSFPVEIYSEAAYRGLILGESRRSERLGHVCRILLVYYTNAQGRVVPFRVKDIGKILSVLFSRCRDTDYIGWYRQDRIMGVLLTALQPDSSREGCDNLKSRIIESLRSLPTFPDDHSLHIRVCERNEPTAFDASCHPVPSPGASD
jgi:hypothetical protein